MHLSTPVERPDGACADLDCRIAGFDARLGELAAADPDDQDARAAYRRLQGEMLEINFGRRIGERCGTDTDRDETTLSAAPRLLLVSNLVLRGRPLEVRSAPLPPGPLGIDLFSVDGRRIRRLHTADHPGGELSLSLPLSGPESGPLPSALYFVRLMAGGVVDVARVLVVD